MNTKPVPITIVLIAAATSCVLSVLQGVEFRVFFFRLLFTVIAFAILGTIAKIVLDKVFSKKLVEEDQMVQEDTEENPENEEGETGETENIENIEADNLRANTNENRPIQSDIEVDE